MCDMTINIYGGNNQILPNATEAVQNLYVYDHANKLQVVQTTSDALSSEAEKLSRYIDKDHIAEHLNKIRACNNATDLAQVVVSPAGSRVQAYRRDHCQRELHPMPASFRHQHHHGKKHEQHSRPHQRCLGGSSQVPPLTKSSNDRFMSD